MSSGRTQAATPAPISQGTVALMIYLCEYMFRPQRPLHPPICDITKLSTTLFGMQFERSFLDACEYQYGWHFPTLFPAIYDGTLKCDNRILGKSSGQAYLRGFATFLCGTFAGSPYLRTPLNDQFEQSLLNDGYHLVGSSLVETDIDTSVPAELMALPNKEALLADIAKQVLIGAPVAVLFIDLDHFKQVNDQISHAEGDNCLNEIARAASAVLARKGKLYRIGGDEFGALLPNFSGSEALPTAERMRAAVDALTPFGGVVKVTVSIGVAASDAVKFGTPDDLLKASDDAMYVVKHTTQNRVCLWPPPPDEKLAADENRKKSRRA
jgi:diguanylate cyclase (GGDEF)-like protein